MAVGPQASSYSLSGAHARGQRRRWPVRTRACSAKKQIKHAIKDLTRNCLANDDVIEPDDTPPNELLNVKRKGIKISDRHINLLSKFSDSEGDKKREEVQDQKDQKDDTVFQEMIPRQLRRINP